ncbi:MAG: hypothetical protein WA058_03350 [Minisyncoccia bacterium]
MSFLGKLFDGLIHDIFGGHGGGSQSPDFAVPPAPPPPPTVLPPLPPVPVPDNTSHNGPMNDVALPTFWSAVDASVFGKIRAVRTGGSSSSETFQFGNMHLVSGTNPDGTPYTGEQFFPFAQLQKTVYSDFADSTDGTTHYKVDTSETGYFHSNDVVPGADVLIQHFSSYSDYSQVTLIGIGHPMPDIYDYGGKG